MPMTYPPYNDAQLRAEILALSAAVRVALKHIASNEPHWMDTLRERALKEVDDTADAGDLRDRAKSFLSDTLFDQTHD